MSEIDKENKVLLILGMHRSGTSLVSNWIHDCGINLGDRLLGAGPTNLYGHFEDVDFLDVHRQILTDNAFDEDGLLNVGEIKVSNYFKNKIKSIVSFKNNMRSQWGWKEPRTCLFLNEYKEVISNPTYLILYRPADGVVDSLLRRKVKEVIESRLKGGWREKIKVKLFKKKIQKEVVLQYSDLFFKTWIRYNTELLNFLKQSTIGEKSFVVVSFKDLLGKDTKVMDWISSRGFEINRIKFDTIYDKSIINTVPVNLKKSPAMEDEIKKIHFDFEKLINKF